jgi:RNA polymerase sigma-B factor
VLEVLKVGDRLFADMGRAPTAGNRRRARGALRADTRCPALAHGDQPLSLDSHATNQLDDEGETLRERFGKEDSGYELVEDRDAAADTIRRLPHLERVVLGLRFLHDMKQSEIATHLGCSQMQVSRLLRRALSKHAELASDDDRVPAGVA